MKKTIFILMMFVSSAPLWAGTEIRALVECDAYEKAWVDLRVSIGDGHLKVHFEGPWCLGALIYDRETSQLTVIDDTLKTVLNLTRENQAELKLLGALGSGKLMQVMAGSTPSAKKTYTMIKENAQSFFNGVPLLKANNVKKADFSCDWYQTDLDGKRVREVWVTSPENGGVNSEDFNTLKGLAHLLLDIGGNELAQLGADTTSFQQGLSTAPLPVYEDLYAGGKHSCKFHILGVRSKDLAPGVFVPPANYRTLGLIDLVK